MLQNNYWLVFAFIVCIYLLWSAEHLTGPKEKLKRIWRNRAEWQKENTTLLRSNVHVAEPGDIDKNASAELTQTKNKMQDIPKETSSDGILKNNVVNTTNILWSRNWHNLVTCSDVPQSYYTAATEKRHSAQEMMKYFSDCGGFVWVRLNSDHKNTKHNDITTFATHVLPKMKKKFVLITTDGDNSVPSNIDKAQDILENPLCMGWYTQNYDGTIQHSKLKPIPIGFDLHTNWKGLWTDNVSENLEKMLELRANSLERTRDTVPFVPPWGANHHERIRSDHALECLHHMHGTRMSIDKLWDTYGSKTFALSPQGNGFDCHRTWELLFFGVIPVVKSVGGLDAMYKDLPVVIVNDWTDVCASNFFVQQRERLKDKWPMSLDKFRLDYWVPRVDGAVNITANTSNPNTGLESSGTEFTPSTNIQKGPEEWTNSSKFLDTPKITYENRTTIIVTGLESSGTSFVSREIAASFGIREWNGQDPYCLKHANTTIYHISLPHNAACKTPVSIHHDIPCTRSLPGGRTIFNITAEIEENPNIKIVVVHRYDIDQIASQKRDHSGGADCHEQNEKAIEILHAAYDHYPQNIMKIEYESLIKQAPWENISLFLGTQVSNAYKDFKLSKHSTYVDKNSPKAIKRRVTSTTGILY